MVDSVLVPVDGSPLAKRALTYVSEEYPDASVHLLYVVDRTDASYNSDWTSLPDLWDEGTGPAGERSKAVIADARETAENVGLEVVASETDVGRPARAIVEYANEAGVDHIVMGSHGRTGLSRYILGSVSERVLRRSTVPVTIVR